MAVDLPPPIPPQQGRVERAPHDGVLARFEAHGYRVQVFGARGPSGRQVAATVRDADSISNGLRALTSAWYAAGFPGARLTYAASGQDLYVLVVLEDVVSVSSAAPLGKYFDGLPDGLALTAEELEPRRLLAGMHADRAGLAGKLRFEGGEGATALVLETAPGRSSTRGSLELGNPGNRFVGRYFADLALATGSRWGDELTSLTRSTVGGLDDDSEAANGEYAEQQLGWNRVTVWGIFGLGGRYASYRFDDPAAPATTYEGVLWVGEARWQYPLAADFDSRLNLQARVDRTGKTTELVQAGARLQQELYTSAELSTTLQQILGDWEVDAGLAARRGLGEGPAPIVPPAIAPDLDYLLYRASFAVRYRFGEGGALALETSGQHSDDTVPEQQQFVLGGAGSVATALPGVAAGDSGAVARLSLTSSGVRALGLRWQARLFADYGYAHFSELGGGSPRLADAGAGLDLARGDWFEAAVTYAEPIADEDLAQATLDDADAGAYFRVKLKF